jgi:hypothetical protein
MGRDVEFLAADPAEVSPDLRIYNLGFPAVVECKMQSRLSAHEKLEFVTTRELFRALAMGPHRLMGILSIVSTIPLEDVGIKTLLEDSEIYFGASSITLLMPLQLRKNGEITLQEDSY